MSEVNKTIRRCLFSDLGQNLCPFLPYFNYSSVVFLQNNLTRQIALIQYIQDDQSARFPSMTNYKNTIIYITFLFREFTIRWDCSLRSICHYVYAG